MDEKQCVFGLYGSSADIMIYIEYAKYDIMDKY